MQLNIYSSNFECRSPGFHGVISNFSRPDLKQEFTELLNMIICDLTSDIIGLDLCVLICNIFRVFVRVFTVFKYRPPYGVSALC